MKKIVVYPAEVLRAKAEKITEVDEKLLKNIKELKTILGSGENAAGLAANQIGVKKRFFGVKRVETGLKPVCTVFINPEITKVYGEKDYLKMVSDDKKETDFLEGCLSLSGLYGTVKRYFKIEVEWEDVGTHHDAFLHKKKKLEGYEAIVFQHELDHLNGILFVDHIKKEGGKLYKMVGEKMIEEKISNF